MEAIKIEATKVYQGEKYQFSENEQLVDTADVEYWDNGTASVILYGIDGNILFESSMEEIRDEEYPEWVEPYLEAMKIL